MTPLCRSVLAPSKSDQERLLLLLLKNPPGMMMMIIIDSVMPQTLTTAHMHIHIFVFSCNLLICTFPSIFLPALPRPSLSCKISEIFRPNNHCRATALDDGPGTKDPVAPIGFKGRRNENFAHREPMRTFSTTIITSPFPPLQFTVGNSQH